MDTRLTIEEIELALIKVREFNIRQNIVVPNVSWGLLNHEADLLIMSKSGYLTEIEIKRSWADFLADFKKNHKHDSELIKYFYYCVPECLREKVYDKLIESKTQYTGVITYDEELRIKISGYKYISHLGDFAYIIREMHPNRKLFIEEELQIARLGFMRVWAAKAKSLLKTEE